jgi:hypothetical protein
LSRDVEDRDLGLAKIIRETGKLDGAILEVGISADEGSHDESGGNLTVAQVGLFHEVGTRTIPARPWLSTAIDDNQNQINAMIKDTVESALDGEDLGRRMRLDGERTLKMVQGKLRNGDPRWPSLAPGTIAKKGSSKPLIDTGQLIQSQSYKVTIGGKAAVRG